MEQKIRGRSRSRENRELTRMILDFSQEMVIHTHAQAVMVYADVFSSVEELEKYLRGVEAAEVILITREDTSRVESLSDKVKIVHVPDILLTRMGQIKMGILLGLSNGVIKRGDRLVCLSGIAGSGVLDTIVFMEMDEEFELFSANGGETLTQCAKPEVFERVMEIAVSLANEGREGKPVGTTFVIGDLDKVKEFSEQIILNPFHGYPEQERNILDPNLEETVKEFASLDGAFLIRSDGAIEAAGVYLRSTIQGGELPMGLGARHKSASAITAVTNSVAITVSESSGTVTVFRSGKIMMEIERPLPPRITRESSREPT